MDNVTFHEKSLPKLQVKKKTAQARIKITKNLALRIKSTSNFAPSRKNITKNRLAFVHVKKIQLQNPFLTHTVVSSLRKYLHLLQIWQCKIDRG